MNNDDNHLTIGIDQSLRTTGFAVFNLGSLCEFSHFTIPANLPIDKRLKTFYNQIEQIIGDLKIQCIYFEDIQNQANNETYKKLAMVQAMLYYYCAIHDIEYKVISPSHWRSVLKERYGANFGRKREEQKRASVEFVKKKFAVECTEDEADAICLGLAGYIENRSAF